jgi:hypothetical protein
MGTCALGAGFRGWWEGDWGEGGEGGTPWIAVLWLVCGVKTRWRGALLSEADRVCEECCNSGAVGEAAGAVATRLCCD